MNKPITIQRVSPLLHFGSWFCVIVLTSAAAVLAAPDAFGEQEPKQAPDPHAGSKFIPLDLRSVANVDPMAKEDPFGLGPEPPNRPYLWVEAETLNKQDGAFGPEARAGASGGQLLGKGFGAKPANWAEWYFDLPFQTEKGQLYLRAAREKQNPSAVLQVTLDGRNVCTFFIPLTGGPGDQEKDFGPELARAELGHIEMGRHVLRITTSNAGDDINLDGFWLSDDQQDFQNRIDDQRRVPPPARPHMLVYPFGPIQIHGVAFDLLDPAKNGGKGILVSGSAPAAPVPCAGVQGQHLQVLGAGITEDTEIEVTVAYNDGASQSQKIHLGTLFTRKPKQPVARFGLERWGYLASVSIQDKPLREIRFGKGSSRYVIVAATLESRPPVGR
ncbi:MAG: hypothetical protein HZB26_03970 [Candidatus Hydrogenedentes bacterium]|nr:hypothetical protein [Candidatus Hydrogenedentota bacterium]